jgi:hypothetical protein
MRLYTSMEAILTLIHMRSSQHRQGTKATREKEIERKKERERETEMRVTKETNARKLYKDIFFGIKNQNGICNRRKDG